MNPRVGSRRTSRSRRLQRRSLISGLLDGFGGAGSPTATTPPRTPVVRGLPRPPATGPHPSASAGLGREKRGASGRGEPASVAGMGVSFSPRPWHRRRRFRPPLLREPPLQRRGRRRRRRGVVVGWWWSPPAPPAAPSPRPRPAHPARPKGAPRPASPQGRPGAALGRARPAGLPTAAPAS